MENVVDVTFTISSILFVNDTEDYYIVKGSSVKMDEDQKKEVDTYIFKGIMRNIQIGDRYEAKCEWVMNGKWGWQLNILFYKLELSRNKRTIQGFIRRNINGVGKKRAELLTDEFGADTLVILKTHPELVAAIKGFGIEKALDIQKQMQEYYALDELSEYMFKNGFTDYSSIMNIYETYKSNSLELIKSNPYAVMPCLNNRCFALIDELALRTGVQATDVMRISNIILFYLSSRASGGDAYSYRWDICSNIYPCMESLHVNMKGITPDDIEFALKSLETNSQIKIEISKESRYDKIYLTRLFNLENEIVGMLSSRVDNKRPKVDESDFNKFMESYKKSTGIECSDEQKAAVKSAMENSVFILTGYPGAGKTLTVNAIIGYIKHRDAKAEITLCAPTGRAAKRMTELTGEQAYTIHRLLKLNADDYNPDDIKQIETDYIIVDEMSMVDLVLLHALLTSIKESDATLIIVGDKNQLPPVGMGFPFRDMIDSERFAHVQLTKLFRQAAESQINRNAMIVLDETNENLCCDLDKQDFFIFKTDSDSNSLNMIISCIKSLQKKGGESMDDIVVLSPIRKTALGSINLNKVIQSIANPITDGKARVKSGEYIYQEGDRVMQVLNNYDKNVYNGDVGKILRIDDKKKVVTVEYEDFEVITTENNSIQSTLKQVEYQYHELDELSLAYSMTVHKSQGTEMPCVIIPISDSFTHLSKDIIYTGITRAKKRVILVGSVNALYHGISNKNIVHKNSGLLEKIKKAV